ncbi:hypothetical protein JOF41_000636 [Saccharothrix coeruleofusca]|uniref:LysM peptidoglycan-binding domain-containing protein n=1 Tax=Saccharothrix coeruleofusca TaxID=33919 RepID=UPI001AE42EC5|nr:LysM peptidoglycan-binding domain-containing protein [Saccharothrix coeruleofusca]MBP2334458.1 hypothetical protein [Saccharothrix coeruleofusca]
MAVVIGTRDGFALVDGAGADDVALGRGPHPGPRVLRRFDVADHRRPAGRRRPVAVTTVPEVAACEVRPRQHPALRLLASALATAAVAVGLAALYLHASGGTSVPERVDTAHVQVGETLRDVARRAAPNSDPDAVVARIRELNGLTDTAVVPGQSLLVPDGNTAD